MDRKKIGRDLSSLKPAPSLRVTSSPVLRLNPKPPHPLPLTLTSTSSPLHLRPLKDLSFPPIPPPLASFTSPHPASSHHPPHSESHRSPCREGRQRPGSPPGPSRSPHPPRWGHSPPPPRPVPAASAQGTVARSRPAWSQEGQRPVRGPRWPGPQAFGCALARGGGTRESPSPSALPAGTETSPHPPQPSCLRWETGPSLAAPVSRKLLTCRY